MTNRSVFAAWILWTLVSTALAAASVFAAEATTALPEPVVLDQGKKTGHTHPSICRTPRGTLVVVYQHTYTTPLMMTRSKDNGASWEKPQPLEFTAVRPEFVQPVEVFQVYPGTLDTLPDGRMLLTWNYIAGSPKEGYYARPLLYATSDDDGRSWSATGCCRRADGSHLGAVRQSVLALDKDRWLLALRDEAPDVLFDAAQGTVEPYPISGRQGSKRPSILQFVRTAKGTLLAMGEELLRSTDDGKSWQAIEGFPGPTSGDSGQGRHLVPLPGGEVVVTWGNGHGNQGFRLSISRDDGQTWSEPLDRLPEMAVTARFGSPRTIPIDKQTLGTAFFNGGGLYFVRTPLDALKQ